jgi:sugar fermentation stimulation protein A
MRFDPPLSAGRLKRRYKRFLADVEIAGRIETVHCPNPGSMLGLAEPGSPVWLSAGANPERKYRFSWELVEAGGSLVGINTGFANGLVAEALGLGRLKPLTGYDAVRREVAYGEGSRIDFLLENPDRPPCYLEVKSVTLSRQPPLAEFPDCITARGSRHLRELAVQAGRGARAVMLFLVQRADCRRVEVAQDIDPAYGRALDAARRGGVEVLAYACDLSPAGIEVTAPLQV